MPLGWTCVGQPATLTTQLINSIKTFHAREIEDLDYRLCRFRDNENEGANTQPAMMTADEKKAVKLVHDSIKYKDCQYEVEIPWNSQKNNEHRKKTVTG